MSGCTCHKSHLFLDKPDRVKSCRKKGISVNIFLLISETCRSVILIIVMGAFALTLNWEPAALFCKSDVDPAD